MTGAKLTGLVKLLSCFLGILNWFPVPLAGREMWPYSALFHRLCDVSIWVEISSRHFCCSTNQYVDIHWDGFLIKSTKMARIQIFSKKSIKFANLCIIFLFKYQSFHKSFDRLGSPWCHNVNFVFTLTQYISEHWIANNSVEAWRKITHGVT